MVYAYPETERKCPMSRRLIPFIVLLLSLTAGLGMFSPSRSIDKAEKFARIRADMFKQELSLHNEQAAAMEKICHEAFLRMKETAAGRDPVKEGEALVQELLMALQKRNADLQHILTPDQLALYQEHSVQRYAELVTEILMMQLDLSESQTGEIHDANIKAFEAIEGYMPKAEGGTKKGQRRANRNILTILQSRDDAFKGILTDRQWEAYEVYREAVDRMFGG
jgi:hypothetical protein